MSLRKTIAIIALVNAMVALYLHMWKLGLTGSLACSGSGGCAFVQGSRFGWFLGIDVALIGAVGYTALFVCAVAFSSATLEHAAWPVTVLQVMIWTAVLFTVRLKYGEFIVLKSFCPWCAISAVSITVCAVLVTLERRRVRRLAHA
ncbi:MAG: vitamin K epoxide reductase family protein [Gemmatimonadetes bacterium]|nr:vitamin K epoxide reductase family protein [Gemmatimonadota bacterium]